MKEENNTLKDVMEYERQLLADRKRLQQLLSEYQGEDDDIVRDKLLFFQSELRHMDHQVELLKSKMEANQNVQMLSPDLSQESGAVSAQPSPSTQQPSPQPEPKQETAQAANVSQKKEAKNLEKMVGSSLMGIVASGLIFISIILFATLIMPYLGNAVKLFACYFVSIVMTGVSLFKLRKNQKNRFYLALSGCGVGALYITLLLTNMYFKYIGDITLFVLIAIWVVFVCYLSKARNPVFHVIGQLGVTISVIFGCILCGSTDDFIKFISLTIFYVISFGTLYVGHYNKETAYNKIGNIFGFINLILLLGTNGDIGEDIYYLFAMLIALAHVLILFLGKWEKSKMSYGVFVSLYGVMIAYSIHGGFSDYEEICGIVIYLIAMVLLLAVEFKEKAYRGGQIFAQIVMVIMAWVGLSMNSVLYDYTYVWLLIVPIILLGFLRKNIVFRFIGLALTYNYLTFSVPEVQKFITGLILLIVLYIFTWWKKEEYNVVFKVFLHLLGVVFCLTAWGGLLEVLIDTRDTRDVLQFMMIAIYNLVLSRSIFSRNLQTGAKESKACYNIINVFMMITGLSLISDKTSLHLLVILLTLVVFLQNSKNLLKKNGNIVAGIYVGLKFTLLLVVILNSFDATNYVVSSLCILFAVSSIVLGFAKQYKSLRIYGLILSMISVFKLIMVDIHYDNTLGNALSFFISGVLCFAISLIYNFVDKKMAAEKENLQQQQESLQQESLQQESLQQESLQQQNSEEEYR